MTRTVAPTPPGRLGEQIDPPVLQAYLAGLDGWVRGRRDELDRIDAAALGSPRRDEVSGDVVLSMALWKAAADRHAELLRVWDSGRVGPTERERLSVLIWGRLDTAGATAPSGVSVSLPEACRLSDALASQLLERLALSPATSDAARRVGDLRAQLERLRDQVALEPGSTRADAQHQWERLATRIDDVAARLERGGDVGGLLGPLENDAARVERDLIVGGARRREAQEQVATVAQLRSRLAGREDAVAALAETAVRTVVPAPRNAVPDVSLLGPVPDGGTALADYALRLQRVGQAMDIAEQRYAAALAERQDLLDQLDAYALKASATGVADQPDCRAAEQAARDLLDRRPAPVAVARHLVAAYLAWVELAGAHAPVAVRRPAGKESV